MGEHAIDTILARGHTDDAKTLEIVDTVLQTAKTRGVRVPAEALQFGRYAGTGELWVKCVRGTYNERYSDVDSQCGAVWVSKVCDALEVYARLEEPIPDPVDPAAWEPIRPRGIPAAEPDKHGPLNILGLAVLLAGLFIWVWCLCGCGWVVVNGGLP